MEPTITLLCQGYGFAILESTAKESPVLSKVIESLSESPKRVIPITDFDLDAVNCFVEFLNRGRYEANQTLFPSVVESAGTGKPLQGALFTRDLLLRHITMNTLGRHYKVSSLCGYARDLIQKILRSQWADGAFLGVLDVALTHDDYELHEILWSQARSHLHSLTATSEFDPVTFLRSFHSNLRACPEPITIDSAEVEGLKEQVTLFQKRTSELSIVRNKLKIRLSEVSTQRDEHHQHLQSQVSALSQQVSDLSKEKDTLHGSLEAASRSRQEAENDTKRAEEHTQSALSRAQAAMTACAQAEKQLQEANERYTASKSEHENSLSTCENDLRITRSERDLLRTRWKAEKDKSSALIKEVDDLKLAIDLERSIKDTVPTTVRDELKHALEAEQREVKRLSTELENAQRYFQGTKSMPQSERDKLYESLGAEKNKVVHLTQGRDQAIAERDAAKRELGNEINARLLAEEKIDDAIGCFDDYEECRHCGWDFGCRLEDDRDRDCVLVRCNRCRTRHWHD
ncbi:hypothetical protein FPOAC1_011699 [Fusarium poae]|uniref:hypothetical protein n=1 Tax=Fusarium poae TaxID=36050 RepID=UPI001CE9236F|nr:hypothetical protein FPOAC1_011699 [Fusarium poae]KAG8666877.1 hypothetical protein FPOAC1_011699 [Fusarium poae]